MSRIVYVFDKTSGKVVPRDEASYQGHGGLTVMRDIEPYKSTITGEIIGGRRQHRQHLRDHKCIEVGNEFKPHKPNWDVGGRVADIKAAMEKANVR